MRILAFLIALAPAAEQDELAGRVKALVTTLGSEDLKARERAQKEILLLGPCARTALEAFRNHDDPEVRVRVRGLLSRVELLRVDAALREPLRLLECERLKEIAAGVATIA